MNIMKIILLFEFIDYISFQFHLPYTTHTFVITFNFFFLKKGNTFNIMPLSEIIYIPTIMHIEYLLIYMQD